MKTTLQELREDILTSVLLSTQTKTIVCAFIDNHLEKERQQIIDSYNIGCTTKTDKNNGETHYNETYIK